MAWAEVGTGHATAHGNVAQITGFSGTGADIIAVATVAYGSAQVAGDLTSSPSNTFSMRTVQAAAGDANVKVTWYYIISPSVSGSMTITFQPPAANFNSIVAYALSQSSAPTFNTSTATGTNSSGNVNIPSLGNANDLVLATLGYYTVTGPTISGGSGWSTVVEVPYATDIGIAASWQQISGAVSPVWATNSGNVVAAQAMAVTGTGGGGGGGTNWGPWILGPNWNRLVQGV